MEIALPLVWAGIIALGVIMYVVMDGFDLGVGILFPLFPHRRDRDVMMNSVAPIWDGNETWLVLGGAGLFGAFPLAYSVILPALYLPLIVMLIGLIFRGVAFEFRFKADNPRPWDWAFSVGSILATFVQGAALGAFVQGFVVVDRAYAGGTWEWLTPFALFTGLALVAGYALLGCGWLILKTEGELQERCWRLVRILALLTFGAVAVVSLWTPLADPRIGARWFSWPEMLYLSPVPLLVVVIGVLLWRAVEQRRERQPFLLALALFILGYAGLAISLWPNVIPPSITIWEAASPPESQGFLLVGVAVLIPVILAYTAYSYWVFRGKVRHGEGYH